MIERSEYVFEVSCDGEGCTKRESTTGEDLPNARGKFRFRWKYPEGPTGKRLALCRDCAKTFRWTYPVWYCCDQCKVYVEVEAIVTAYGEKTDSMRGNEGCPSCYKPFMHISYRRPSYRGYAVDLSFLGLSSPDDPAEGWAWRKMP